jgi:predicted dehydrogenase
VYRAAIIGCGKIAGGYDQKVPTEWSLTHAGAYHLCPETRLVAVADADPSVMKAFQEKWHIERGYIDYLEMLKNEPIEILSLCLPTEYHYDAFKAAVDHGIRAIYCEKPLSQDLDEARRMVDLSRGRVVSVNYFRRWNPTIGAVAERLRRGDFGKGINATVRYTKGLFVNGSHLVDLMRWFWGDPKHINFIRIAQDDLIDPGVDFCLGFDNAAMVYFVNVPKADYVFVDVDILLEEGRVVIEQRGQTVNTYSVTQDPHYLFHILDNSQEVRTRWQNCTTRAVQQIVECLQNGGNTSCTAESAYRTLEVCHQVLSLRN